MPWSMYQLPTQFLMLQGHDSAIDLAGVAKDIRGVPWREAGVDVEAHAREVAAATEALSEASTAAQLADSHLAGARCRAELAAGEATRWRAWVLRVVREAAAAGQPVLRLGSTRDVRRRRALLEDLRGLVADVARERARLAVHVQRPELLDEGAAKLAKLEATSVREAEALAARVAATAAEREARTRLARALKAVDRAADRVEAFTGERPRGASRHVLRPEARRRTELGVRRRAGQVEPAPDPEPQVQEPEGVDA